MYRVTALARAVALLCLAASVSFLSNSSAQAQGSGKVNWTGFYIGAHGTMAGFDQEFPGAPPHPAGPPRMDLNGGMLGGQIGYNWQLGGIVLGVEGDYSRGNLTETVRDGNFITQTGEIDWTGTLRARVGLPMGTLMPYLTAGYMWAGASYNQACPDGATHHCGTFKKYSLTDTQTHTGLVYGGGLEWAVSRNFSVKAEGLWYNLSNETYELGTAPISGLKLGPKFIEYDGAMFRIGGNYRF